MSELIDKPRPRAAHTQDQTGAGHLLEIFLIFLRLGLTSFGGPIAHIGYFREAFVVRRQWMSDAGYADLVALCQFLPGPASSQVGFSLGVLRGRSVLGGVAAWAGFTLPSALILCGFALASAVLTGPVALGTLHGLKLVAVSVVAQAVWGMAQTLAPDRERASIAMFAVVCGVLLPAFLAQPAAITAGALVGLFMCRSVPVPEPLGFEFPVSRWASAIALIVALALFLVPAVSRNGSPCLALFEPFYRAGALVFGGGHVVLPLLEAAVVAPGWIGNETFLTGYGLTQAVPGPLFTFAAYLGAALVPEPYSWAGAAIALVAIFLPGLLLVYGMLPYWGQLRNWSLARGAMRGANAAVVGVLGLALYNPVWTSAVRTPMDFAIALTGFFLLIVWNAPPWTVVALLAAGGALLGRA